MRTCLLAFHVTDDSYPAHDDVIEAARFPGSVSDDAIMAGDAPGQLLNMHEDDVDAVMDNDVYDMKKEESRSTLGYRKAESVV